MAAVASGFTGVAQANDVHNANGGRQFYLDCGSAGPSRTGVSAESPWNSLKQLNSFNFAPGDTISLKRGTECHGTIAPQGSGSERAPIRLTAYGEGPRPRIIAETSAREALKLFNQEYWDIDSLDLSGGTINGVFISGDKGILHHIHLSNLAVHDVIGGEMKHKESGLVAITPGSVNQRFDDVVVDGVTAWNTNQWVGIIVGGGNLGYPPESDWNTNVEIRNSAIHDVQGDGIVLFRVIHGRIDSSVAWNTGMQVTETIGTPNAIWTWMCDDCTVEGNEAYLTDSPGVDGGAYDIDYGNTKNSVIDNYGHDTQGYCVAVFGAGFVTRESTVRGNLCINNGRSPRMAKYQGAIFPLSWNDGSIDGLTVENNTVYWSPFENSPALVNQATIKAGTAAFRNNTIYSTSPRLVNSNTSLSLAQNHYSYYGGGTAKWRYGTSEFGSLQELQNGPKQETGSHFVQKPLQEWADAGELPARATQLPAPTRAHKGWKLESVLPFSLDQVLRLRKSGARFDYYVMDAFWFDPNGAYRTWKKPNWPNGPDLWIKACQQNGIKPGLWFSTNTLVKINAAPKWRDSLNKKGTAMSMFEGGFLPDFMDTLQYWYDHGMRMFLFDFADLTAATPKSEATMTKEEIIQRNSTALQDALASFRARIRTSSSKPSMDSAATWTPPTIHSPLRILLICAG